MVLLFIWIGTSIISILRVMYHRLWWDKTHLPIYNLTNHILIHHLHLRKWIISAATIQDIMFKIIFLTKIIRQYIPHHKIILFKSKEWYNMSKEISIIIKILIIFIQILIQILIKSKNKNWKQQIKFQIKRKTKKARNLKILLQLKIIDLILLISYFIKNYLRIKSFKLIPNIEIHRPQLKLFDIFHEQLSL